MSATEPAPGRERHLARRLSARQLAMIGIGGAIGTGLFLGSSLAISQAGPATILAYLACALMALIIAWALAEMVVVHPVAGSFGALAHSYLGRMAGFVTRWTYWAVQCVAIGGEVVAAGIYMRFWWPGLPLWLPTVLFAAGIIAVNAAAVGIFGNLEYWFSVIKVSAIVVFVVLGVVLICFGLPGSAATGLDNLTVHGGFFPHGIEGLLLAVVFAIFSFTGTEVVSVTAAEAREPVRGIRKATRSMLARLTLFYLLAITIVLSVVSWVKTAQGGEDVRVSPFVAVFSAAGIPAAATIMNFVVLTAALSSANTNLYLTTRMLHSLAEHRYAPAFAGKLTNSGVPARALVLSTIGLGIAAVSSFAFPDTAFVGLYGISIFGLLVVWLLILVTHLRFRRVRARHGLPASPVRLFGAPVTTIIGILFLASVLISTAFIDNVSWSWKAGIPFFAILVIAFLIVDRRRGAEVGTDPLAAELAARAATQQQKEHLE